MNDGQIGFQMSRCLAVFIHRTLAFSGFYEDMARMVVSVIVYFMLGPLFLCNVHQ